MRLTGRKLRLGLLLGATAALAVGSQRASGLPLDGEACTRLKEEQADLVKTGTKANMDRGPAWAKANLSPEKLKDIEHFIDLQEQILFRCPQSKPLVEIVDGEEGAATAPTKPKKTLAKATASPADDAAPAPKAPKKAAAAPAKAAGAVATTPAPVKKSPPKPKPSDAYIPPVKLDGE